MLLKFAYEDFIADGKFNNTSKSNITNYRYLLKPFIDYCLSNDIQNVEDVSSGDVREYLMMCQESGNNPSTINSKLLRIRAFFNYMVDERIININPSKKLRCKKQM